MALTGTIVANLNFILTGTNDFGLPKAPAVANNTLTFANGTGANQARQIFADQRSLARSANEELDLSGVLGNALGEVIAFTAIKTLYIKAASNNAGTLTVGGAASNAWETWVAAAGDSLILRPGGILLLVAPDETGYAVTAGTADKLKITNNDSLNLATYDILLVGE